MKNSKLVFEFHWKTCRDTPFLDRKEIWESLAEYFAKTHKESGVTGWDIHKPNEIEVTVVTEDVNKAPNQIFWELSRDTASYLLKKHPDLSRLPSIWTRSWSVTTKGKA